MVQLRRGKQRNGIENGGQQRPCQQQYHYTRGQGHASTITCERETTICHIHAGDC